MKCLVVHPADHEHLTAVVLLHHGTHETVGVALQANGDLGSEGGRRGYRGHMLILPCEPLGEPTRSTSVGYRGADNRPRRSPSDPPRAGCDHLGAVSYTHLTLPTNREVSISVVAVSF